MTNIIEQLKELSGKTLKTDEIAFFENARREAVNELENLEYKSSEEYLLLKWGTIKGINFKSKKGKDLIKEYNGQGSCSSAMMQEDTGRQREIICEMIDVCKGEISNDWTGESLTREQAKEYVTTY